MLNYNKKSQVGETTSWIVATIVIIGILIIFIYIAILMSKIKTINTEELKIYNLGEETGILEEKTSLAYQLSGNKNKEIIDNILKENG